MTADRIAKEQAAARERLPRILTDDVLDAMTVTAIACTENQSEAIAFVLWAYEQAGKEAPDFGRFSELET